MMLGTVFAATALAILTINGACGSPVAEYIEYDYDTTEAAETGTSDATIEIETSQATIEIGTSQATIEIGTSQATTEIGTSQATIEIETSQATTEIGTSQATIEIGTSEATTTTQTTDPPPPYDSQTETISEFAFFDKKNIFDNAISYLELTGAGVNTFINEISNDKGSAEQISGYDRLILTFIYSVREGKTFLSKLILLLLDDVKPTDSGTFKENIKNLFSFSDSDVKKTFEYLNSGKKCHGLPEHVIDSLFDFLEITTAVKYDKTVLEYGLSNGYVHAITLLITRGTGAKEINEKGDTLLHFAAQVGSVDSITDLLDNGMNVDTKNKEGQTPLYFAAKEKTLGAVMFLLSRGADIDSKDENGDSLLHIAAKLGDIDAASSLIELGASVDKNNEGITPLFRAAQHNMKDMMKFLISKGADIRRTTEDGDGLIHFAVLYNETTAVENLLDLGVEIETPGHSGFTPLHLVARSGLVRMVRLLLDRGAKVDSLSKVGRTPLHEAAFWSQFEVVEELVRHGADVAYEDPNGEKPVDMAKMNDHIAMVKLLTSLEKNVKVIY